VLEVRDFIGELGPSIGSTLLFVKLMNANKFPQFLVCRRVNLRMRIFRCVSIGRCHFNKGVSIEVATIQASNELENLNVDRQCNSLVPNVKSRCQCLVFQSINIRMRTFRCNNL
jgi:hypothetical protein